MVFPIAFQWMDGWPIEIALTGDRFVSMAIGCFLDGVRLVDPKRFGDVGRNLKRRESDLGRLGPLEKIKEKEGCIRY